MKHVAVILSLALLLCALPVAAKSQLERMDERPVSVRMESVENERAVIGCRDGIIYITAMAPVEVRVFNILGQLITSSSLRPGSYRLAIEAHGIYIVKIGSATRRVVI